MKQGILSLGTTVVDFVKLINNYPSQGNLTEIISIEQHVGGNVCNLLVNLAIMDPLLPLTAGGFIGNDAGGGFISDYFKKYNIDTKYLFSLTQKNTSFTDVMSSKKEKQRTFFYHPGASSELSLESIDNIQTSAKIIQIGYLGTLPKLEIMKNDKESDFSLALRHFCQQGCLTTVDMVSGMTNDNLRKVFYSCLPFIHFLIINEIETEAMLTTKVRNSDGQLLPGGLKASAKSLLDSGVTCAAVIHCPEVAVYADTKGQVLEIPSFYISKNTIKGSVGAGDAFSAGFLYGIHEGYEPELALRLGHASARFNLDSFSSTGGAKPLSVLRDFIENN